MRTRLLSLSLTALLATGAQAQSIGRMVLDDVTWAARDFGAIWLSPLHGSGRDYLIAAGVLAGGALVSPFDDNVDRWALANRDRGVLKDLGPLRRGGSFYSLNKGVPYAGGLYVVALATKHRGLRDGIFGCLSAYSANTTIRHQLIYRVIGRVRPDTTDAVTGPPAQPGDQYDFMVPSDGKGTHSFPGGHVATAATCASFFANRYDAKWVNAPLVLLVTAMGVGRIADRGHWLSDQVVGVAFGYAVGREVARRQLRRLDDEKMGSIHRRTGSGPFLNNGPTGVAMGWQRTF